MSWEACGRTLASQTVHCVWPARSSKPTKPSWQVQTALGHSPSILRVFQGFIFVPDSHEMTWKPAFRVRLKSHMSFQEKKHDKWAVQSMASYLRGRSKAWVCVSVSLGRCCTHCTLLAMSCSFLSFGASDWGYIYCAALLSDLFASVLMFSRFTASSSFSCIQRHVRAWDGGKQKGESKDPTHSYSWE